MSNAAIDSLQRLKMKTWFAFLFVATSCCAATLRASVSTPRSLSLASTNEDVNTPLTKAEKVAMLIVKPSDPKYRHVVRRFARMFENEEASAAIPHTSEDTNNRELTNPGNQVTTLDLINAETDEKIVTLKDGMVVSLRSIRPRMSVPSLNINASFNVDGVRSVVYGYNNTLNVNTENAAPFAFCRNDKADFFSCQRLGLGTHTITVTPYAKSNARGTPGTPYTLTFTVVDRDRTLPTLINFVATSPTTVDVSTGSATVDFQVTIQDDISGLTNGVLGVDGEGFNFFPFGDFGQNANPTVGEPVTFDVTMTIKRYTPPGQLPLQVNFGDTEFNIAFNSASALAALGFISSVTVINTGLSDTTPPQLLSFTANGPLTVNPSAQDVAIDFQLTVQDDISGINYGGIYGESYFQEFGKENPEGCFLFNNGPELPSGIPHSFPVSVVIPQGTAPGELGIEFFIYDGIGNTLSLSSTELNALGLPSKVTVVA